MTHLHGEQVELRSIADDDRAPLRAIRETPEVDRWWGPLEEDFPEEDYPDGTRLVVLLGGEVIGMVQYEEEPDAVYRHADVDIFLDPAHHGRGLGTDAMRTIADYLITERGHHRLTLTTSPDNAGAIRCYEKAGFRRVGVTRASELDVRTGKWVDELLMELVDLRTGHTSA